MTYGTFKTYEEVAIRFRIKLIETSFIQESSIEVPAGLFEFINDNLRLKRSYISENAICENIISPILNIISKHHNISLWSHVRLDVSEKDGLVGIPDFLIAPVSDIGTTFTQPIICVAEAKKENFNEGWAQALSEMIAIQRFNETVDKDIYGIVTTGLFWQFGKLNQTNFTQEVVAYSAVENLQRLFDVLNGLFLEAKKTIIE
ncbi:MAG: hypothetical protein GQ569_05660 [Methylococcaceae bacterium]|nr:hypothetical protein [Methylococcaceae bacterium]